MGEKRTGPRPMGRDLEICAPARRATRRAASSLSKRVAGSRLWEPLLSLSAGLKCVPSSLDLVMALQLSREQGITLRGSAEIVAEFFYWLYKCSVQKLVVIISDIESGEVLERWQFDIECDKTAKDDSTPREKSQKAIQDEIRSVIRQITATVTFLPLLEVSCSFDLLIYTDKDLVVPEKWEESGPQFITNSEEVRLRSFTTTIHKVNSMVAYKIPVND
ncbi:hypothetical protein MC885_006080 [Smutsia gigantea]|nr:hypothetical protein MC885_006080 [Smutsia gigantea]